MMSELEQALYDAGHARMVSPLGDSRADSGRPVTCCRCGHPTYTLRRKCLACEPVTDMAVAS